MTIRELEVGDGTRLAYHVAGPDDPAAPTLVFANALGTTMSIWDAVVADLPAGLRILRYDMRGHGKSSVPQPPYTMGTLISDAAAVCDAADARDVMFVGLSVGGMVAQGLAIKRPDLIRALVLSNTAARIGHAAVWQDRIEAVRRSGLAAMADAVLDRWFAGEARHGTAAETCRDMLLGMSPDGYVGVCAAISGTDFYTTTASLRCPTLGIAGSEDKSTPPDLVRETVDLIPGSQFVLIRRAGHLPCVDQPTAFAGHLRDFVTATGHMAV